MKPDSITLYEAKALTFYRMTGMMAPGKDVPAGSSQRTFEVRHAAWDVWNLAYASAVELAIGATLEIAGDVASKSLAEEAAEETLAACRRCEGELVYAAEKLPHSNAGQALDIVRRAIAVASVHIHAAAGDGSDDCKLCGRDLRNPIHRRL